MTDYKAIAKQLESLGMGGDKHLIHVNPTELQLIQKTLGRKPSRNPHTGLRAFDDSGGGDSESDHGDTGHDPGSNGDSPSEHGGGFGEKGGTGPDADHTGGISDKSDNSVDFGQDLHDVNPDDYTVDMEKYKQATENFNYKNTDIFSRGLSAVTGINLGHNINGDIMVSKDINFGSMIGGLAGLAGGFLGGAVTDLLGVPHGEVQIGGPQGLSFTTTPPSRVNDTNLADALAYGADKLGFNTGVTGFNKAADDKSTMLSGIKDALEKNGVATDTTSGPNTGTSGDTKSGNVNQENQSLTSENLALQQQVSSMNLQAATAVAGTAGSNPFFTTGDPFFDFDRFALSIPGSMTPSQIAQNKSDKDKKKSLSLGDFIQNAAQAALGTPAKPFAFQTPLIVPGALVSPHTFG